MLRNPSSTPLHRNLLRESEIEEHLYPVRLGAHDFRGSGELLVEQPVDFRHCYDGMSRRAFDVRLEAEVYWAQFLAIGIAYEYKPLVAQCHPYGVCLVGCDNHILRHVYYLDRHLEFPLVGLV